jgi:hypothetical protein
MKKKLFMFSLMLFAAMSIQAQSLIGTWKTATEIDEDGDATSWTFTFKKGNLMTLKMTMSSSDEEVGAFEFGLSIPGSYKRTGNSLSLSLDPSKANGKIEKMEFKGEMATLINSSAEMKKTVTDMLQTQVDQELKKNFSDELPFDGEIIIVSLTSTTLELQADDELLKFTRVN